MSTYEEEDQTHTFLRKHLVKENQYPKVISHVQFGLLSPKEMQRLSEFEINSRDLFTMVPTRRPAHSGCLDPRLGISDKISSCATCKNKLADCAGHFGYIRLALPVFHLGFIKQTIYTLQCICKTCSRILLNNTEQESARRKMTHPMADVLSKSSTFMKTVEKCKKVRVCPHCHEINGVVKKIHGVSTLKIVHEKYKAGRYSQDVMEDLVNRLETAVEKNNDVQLVVKNGYVNEDLLPTKALELFSNIPKEDVELLWMDPLLGGRPENLILQNLLVPPVPIRPSVSMDRGQGSNEDDLTVKLQEIVDVNFALKCAMDSGVGVHTRTIMEEWDFLQVQCAQYINGDMPGIARPMGVKSIRGLCQRLKGKQGRFRGNLSGKRVDFSGRTVIGPDPNLSVEQVGVPVLVAKRMTYPETVNKYNIEKLRKRVINGPEQHPGANQIRLAGGTGFIKSLQFGDRNRAAQQLRIGDVVERHMEDGDLVLFNRQPSLHKMSIMSHRVKVLPYRTFRFNIQVCAPYNADFDGDEMNMHLPQTEEARAECQELMSVRYNLMTGRNGEPLVAASQDFLTASYLITAKKVFLTKEDFCQLVCALGDGFEDVEIPIPAIIKPKPLWTGKQLFTMIVNTSYSRKKKMFVNFEMKEKMYDSKKDAKHFCQHDGWVCFRNNELLSGTVAKKTIGGGSKKGLLYVLVRDCGEEYATKFMDRFGRLCSRLMGFFRGFSIGIDDVTPSESLKAMKHGILTTGYEKAEENIRLYDEGKLDLRPGCNLLQSLEEVLNGILGKLRESAGQEAVKALPYSNAPRSMATCGSKGSPLNISQMMACVGQQAVGGKRIENGFVDRTLPHFEYHSLTPAAKGFVANSFYTGLSATEFFFHTQGGREGLVDTAVKTAETGYMARRLMKALEDLSLQYDLTVRNSENTIIQFIYGDDNLNPQCMEDNDRPVDLNRVHMNVIQIEPCLEERALYLDDMKDYVSKLLDSSPLVKFVNEKFLGEINSYFDELATKQKNILDNHIDQDERCNDILFQQIWKCRLTKTQLDIIIEKALQKYCHALVEPGEAIGANGAQSISEPGTQMTLKTFHFAGVSSMNVTLGVPRLKEIINASKNISTPIITARLIQDNSKIGARVVKAVIEKTTLGEVASYIKEVYSSGKTYLSVQLDLIAIEQLKLGIDATSVRKAILRGAVGETRPAILRSIKEHHVIIKRGSKSKLRILVPEKSSTSANAMSTYYSMQALKTILPRVIVQGITTVNRAVINEESKGGKTSYHLLVEGYGLSEVMGSPGIDGRHTTTNHVIEVENTLGVEAARTQISAEISYIMSAYGIGIDIRHLMLLSDIMTFKGEVLGITRYGVSKMKESVLMLASFEKTTDHLFDAAVHGRSDAISGVSECIIMGIPMPIGTGLFKLLRKADETVSVSDPAFNSNKGNILASKNGERKKFSKDVEKSLEERFNSLLLN